MRRWLLAVALFLALASPAFGAYSRRNDTLMRVLGSYFAPSASYTVSVLPVGAEASAGSSGTTITVRAGHGVSGGQKIMVNTTASTYRLVSSVGATSIVVGSAVTVVSGDIIVNLGADTGSTGPNYDDATVAIYSDMAGGTTLTPSQVTSNSSGYYGYWHVGTAAWELIRTGSGTPTAIVRGAVTVDAVGSGLAANPAACSANQFVNDIAQDGTLACSAIADADVPNTITIDLATAASDLTCTDCIGATEIADSYLLNNGDAGTGVYDFGGADSFEIPNGTAPTVDAAGEAAVDTTDDQLVYFGGAKRVVSYTHDKCVTLEDPVDADDNIPFFFPRDPITVTDVYCEVDGGTSIALTISDGTNALEAITCDADGAEDDGTIANGTFTALERMEFDLASASGTSTWLAFCVTYTVDAQ